MKSIVILPVLLFLSLAASSQAPNTAVVSKEDYLKKSTDQKTAGWVVLSGGTALIVAGIAVASHGGIFDESWNTGGTLATIGLLGDLASIPLFIASARNAKKAAAISMGNRHILRPGPGGFVRQSQPSISFCWTFGR